MEAHHLHLALSSLITLSFFLTILPPSYCTDNARFVECSIPFDCERIKNIPYSFLGENRSKLCSFQEFKLTCRDNEYPIIRIEELEFLVLNINQSQYIMTIARLDLWNSPCPPKFVNTPLDFNNFKYYTPTDQNLILFYGCPSGVSGLDGVNFSCSLDNTANYFVDDLFEGYNTSIEVPILRTALIDESVGLQNVLNQGFDVDYHNDRSITCLGCEAWGGICGFNSSHPFVCFCHDGEQSLVCSSNGMHVRFSSLS